ncbi:MAG: D-alanyl-lipoteichoic acid biosynthesis protein DltD [Chthoniobacteraceae bacterium]
MQPSPVPPGSSAKRPHLVASGISLAIASVAVAAALFYCGQLESQYIHALAPEFSTPKLQGVALQEEAYNQDDLLVMYGSSELVKVLPGNANEFFANYPTGFRVFPIGKPGTTSLAVLQKVAAVGDEVRGRKLAYSISPGFFFWEVFDPKYYEGNFSELQASEMIFNSKLSWGLKRDIARRMLDYPRTLEGRWLLRFAVERAASGTKVDRALVALAWPLGQIQTAVGRAQDHVEAALHILDEDERLNPNPARKKKALDWAAIFRTAGRIAASSADQARKNELARQKPAKALRDKAFLSTIAKAKEWTDFELFLRTLKELGVQPLLLSMPIEDSRLVVSGLSSRSREAYVSRMEALARRYSFPIRSFREHEKESEFLTDFSDHLSTEGWAHYNKALDDFYHGRISKL